MLTVPETVAPVTGAVIVTALAAAASSGCIDSIIMMAIVAKAKIALRQCRRRAEPGSGFIEGYSKACPRRPITPREPIGTQAPCHLTIFRQMDSAAREIVRDYSRNWRQKARAPTSTIRAAKALRLFFRRHTRTPLRIRSQ